MLSGVGNVSLVNRSRDDPTARGGMGGGGGMEETSSEVSSRHLANFLCFLKK
jgi:hypothetical protein